MITEIIYLQRIIYNGYFTSGIKQKTNRTINQYNGNKLIINDFLNIYWPCFVMFTSGSSVKNLIDLVTLMFYIERQVFFTFDS